MAPTPRPPPNHPTPPPLARHRMGGDEPPGPHTPCVRGGGGGVKRWAHLLNGSPKTCSHPPKAVDAS
eukprot:2319830-Prymnesium_polylepis.1